MRVLLVEDDNMVGAAVAQALKDAAYAVDWVTDGEAAIHAAEAETYDLALLDLGLPIADGLEVLRRFRKICGQLPIIIVTARGRSFDARGAAYLRSSATASSVSILQRTKRVLATKHAA
jgi:DNA-binding response OmpR family regulator